MDKKGHLPVIGVGPLIVVPQLIITAAGIIMSELAVIPRAELGIFNLPCYILGIALIVLALYLWFSANFKEKINAGIKNNHLITTGAYAMTRNPIYSAFFLICCSTILMANNLLLFVVPGMCWLYMTVFLKRTEEVWLLNLYGTEYEAYCKKVHRIIPCIPRP